MGRQVCKKTSGWKKLNAAISDIELILTSSESFKMVAEEWIENQKPELKASSNANLLEELSFVSGRAAF